MSPLPRIDPEAERATLARVEAVAHRMDRAFRLPGTRIRLGWDSIVGLIPGIGDTLALAPALYIIAAARRLGAPWPLLLKMSVNLGIDWLIGLVPLAGDLLDVGYKANTRNARALRDFLDRRDEARMAQAPEAAR
ncbi:DUF4112 domain-containing protein [Roseivivax sp. GX 12232]|uniref:DUF4112 domain-containing protein n=1 Tax=Roseivivax sp. GX 12232 TaxID=2900547 RepID=UPI001E330732|nr:DUF4112 domain-containing protein [Roseivivax sp. GX 12232]MCE0504602.1 DUF4112 domain-containing protein [Roseivivax sp. GX 12232]